MSTPMNTPGMGNAQPSGFAAMTGAEQSGHSAIGSGDKWGNVLGPYTQSGSIKRKKKKRKKHKIKKLESYLSNNKNKLNESSSTINFEELLFIPYKQLTPIQLSKLENLNNEDAPYLYAGFKKFTRNEKKNLIAIDYRNEIIGYFIITYEAYKDLYIPDAFKTSEKYKGQGLCKKVLGDFFKDKKGYAFIHDKNTGSINCMTSIGFVLDKKDPNGEGSYYIKK